MSGFTINEIIGDYRKGFVNNGSYKQNVKIHFIEKNPESRNQLAIVFSPGLWEPAERAIPLFEALDNHCISFSYRGRGLSDTPPTGYDLEHHVSDFNTVIEGLEIKDFIIVAFSRGVGYACGYVEKYPGKVKGMVLVDHPPIHTKPQAGYAQYWKNLFYLGSPITNYMRPQALDMIEKEANEYLFWKTLNKLDIPITLLVGASKSSKIQSDLRDEDLLMYREHVRNYKEINFDYSGHMIVDEELGKYRSVVKEFAEDLEKQM